MLLRCLTLNIDYSHLHLKVLVYSISVSRTYSLSERKEVKGERRSHV